MSPVCQGAHGPARGFQKKKKTHLPSGICSWPAPAARNPGCAYYAHALHTRASQPRSATLSKTALPGRSKRPAPESSAATPLQYCTPQAVQAAVRAPHVPPAALPTQLTASRPPANFPQNTCVHSARSARPGGRAPRRLALRQAPGTGVSRGSAGSSALCYSQAVASKAMRSGREDGKLRHSRPRQCRLSPGSHQRLASWCPRRPGDACSSQRAPAERARRQRHPSCWRPYRPAVRQRLISTPTRTVRQSAAALQRSVQRPCTPELCTSAPTPTAHGECTAMSWCAGAFFHRSQLSGGE